MNLQTKSILAQLPRPLQENYQTWCSPVCSLSGPKKRKRYEVAIAVDGEAVNIYDVQSPKLITSYPVPPQSRFTCAPCSLRSKNDGVAITRRTYCSIRRPASQLQCYTERSESKGPTISSTTVSDLGDTESPAIFLQVIPNTSTPSYETPAADIVVIHQNGTIRRLSSDLQLQRWCVQASLSFEEPASSLVVAAAHWTSIEDAKKGVLRRREDIITSPAGHDRSFLLLVIEKVGHFESEDNVAWFGVWSLEEPENTINPGNGLHHKTSPIILHKLPHSSLWNQKPNVRYDFSSISGGLSIGFSGGLITYNLATFTPEILSRIGLEKDEFSSFMRLTSPLVVGASGTSIALYDTKYQSKQATLTLENGLSRREKKKAGGVATNTIQFVSYFSKIHTIIALRGRTLMAFDTTPSAQASRHTLLSAGLLTDSIGRGVQYNNSTDVKIPAQSQTRIGAVGFSVSLGTKHWVEQQKNLDAFFEARDTQSFEELMAAELCDVPNTKAVAIKREFKLPPTTHNINLLKIRYLISKIFQPSPKIERRKATSDQIQIELKVTFLPPRLFPWLIESGFLVPSEVETALLMPSMSFVLRPGAICRALVADDSSFETLNKYLQKSSRMPLSELVESIKVLLEDALTNDQKSRSSPQLLLEAAEEMHIDSETPVGENQVQEIEEHHVARDQNTERPVGYSSRILLLALDNFSLYASSTITSEVRSRLDQPKIFALIQCLRQQMFRGGYTTSFQSPGVRTAVDTAFDPPMIGSFVVEDTTLSLDAIIKVLSSSIDALGPLSLLASDADEDFIETLIPDLRTEVSLALVGIEEASYLKGVMREIVRYGDSLTNQQHLDDFETSTTKPRGNRQQRGTIATLFSEPISEKGDPEAMSSFLPLALRGEDIVKDAKIRKGGGQVSARNQRQKLYLQRRNVGRYSFERLVL